MVNSDDELLKFLKSFADPNELARTLIAETLWDRPEEEFEILTAWASTGDGEASQQLRALVTPRKRKSSHALAARERQFNRIRKHHPALEKYAPLWKNVGGEHRSEEEDRDRTPDLARAEQAKLSPEQLDQIRTSLEKQSADDLRRIEQSYTDWDRSFMNGLRAYLDARDNPNHSSAPLDPLANPFRPAPPVMQPSMLTAGDAIKVFNAISFAMWKHGTVMNTHIIIIWSMIPRMDEQNGMRVLGLYLNEARKWLGVGSGPRRRMINDARQGEQMHHVWVHENAVQRGFHSHVLTHVPDELQGQFEVWSRARLAGLCKAHFPWKAFRLVRSYAKSNEDKVRGAWRWYRYLMKQLDPAARLRVEDSLEGVSAVALRDILKPWPARKSPPIPRMKLAGTSHSIGEGAQDTERFFSMLNQARFDELYNGLEFEDRRREELFKGIDPEWHSEFKNQ